MVFNATFNNISSIFTSDDNMNPSEATNYIEKIDNFVLQEFNNKQQPTPIGTIIKTATNKFRLK
jgi:hypothetical protein